MLLRGLEGVVGDLDGVVEALGSEVDGVAGEGMEVEAVLVGGGA